MPGKNTCNGCIILRFPAVQSFSRYLDYNKRNIDARKNKILEPTIFRHAGVSIRSIPPTESSLTKNLRVL